VIDDVKRLLTTAMEEYFTTACAPPKRWNEVRPDNCELCERNVFLSYVSHNRHSIDVPDKEN